MKYKNVGKYVLMLMIATVISTASFTSACTTFQSYDIEDVLIGSNMDWSKNFDNYIHFFPEEEGKFGRVIFEFPFPLVDYPDWICPKQGMNDQGLHMNVHLAPYLNPGNSSGKPFFESSDPDYYQIGIHAYCLAKCATVAEVIDIYDQYNLYYMSEAMAFFVDINGDSVIIEGDDIIYKEGDFQVITNYYQSHPEVGGYPCWRYDKAVSMLENMTELSVDYFASICDETHVPTTIFSNVYDLIDENFFIYYNNDFTNYLEFDLSEELAKGKRRILLGTLFDFEENEAPHKSDDPEGPTSGLPKVDYLYKCNRTSDPDGDRIMYLFDWDDGSDSDWIHATSNMVEAEHSWNKTGSYQVRVKTMDIYGRESVWSNPLEVIIPRTRTVNHLFLHRLFERFPNLLPLLRQMGGFD
jgi:choloylglycine hydrolase